MFIFFKIKIYIFIKIFLYNKKDSELKLKQNVVTIIWKGKNKKLLNNLKDNLPKLIDMMNNQELNEYVKTVVNFSFEANKYFNDSEPWAVKKSDLKRMNTILC